ncbi:hypothetical protein HMPREF3160_00335 [Arthrobacter sp. HMSC06H05]|nr:hypothetical protein HMPREF3160_00335 [Arthrobacter sp. HMSC06H05]
MGTQNHGAVQGHDATHDHGAVHGHDATQSRGVAQGHNGVARGQFVAGTSGVGVLLIHGFTSNPACLGDWGKTLHDAGHTVSMPLLPGHGTRWQDLESVTADDWCQAVESAYDALAAECDSVAVGGLSMGGTLTAYLGAVRRPDHLFFVNPAFTYPSMASFAGVMKRFLPTVGSIGGDVRKEGVSETAYERVPVTAVDQMTRLVARTRRMLPGVDAPITLFRSTVDHIIPDSSVRVFYRDLQSRVRDQVRYVELRNSYHVATLDEDAPLIFSTSRDEVDEIAQRLRASGGKHNSGGKHDAVANTAKGV